MTLPVRWIVVAVIGCLLLGWWLSNPAPTLPVPDNTITRSIARAGTSACPLPPLVERGAPPLQSEVPSTMPALSMEGATLQPLAGFSIEARVLGREDYRMGREADYSPTDLALGWGRMTDDAVLSQLDISQGGRWYRYRWTNAPPIPVAEIVRSSANMHMIPANPVVAKTLARVKREQRISLRGQLVRVEGDDGFRWVSSLSRDDTGDGACEVIWLEHLEILP